MQSDSLECGPTCLRIIAKYYGKTISLGRLQTITKLSRNGTTMLSLSKSAEELNFRTYGTKTSFEQLDTIALPCIIHWESRHFVVLYKIKKNTIFISDPEKGLVSYSKNIFISKWVNSKENNMGYVLALEPTPNFFSKTVSESELNLSYILGYFLRYKKFILQLIVGLIVSSFIQLLIPFLTQSVVDVGIQNQDISFINLVLLAQLALFIGQTSVDTIRSWIFLHLSTRINISLISDFFIKLMKLPLAYFDKRSTGDLLQRINDHYRIESLITNNSLSTLFSLLNFAVFSLVLAYYSMSILVIFSIGSVIYLAWVSTFLKYRKKFDYKRFEVVSAEQSKIIEIVNGIEEIKLSNSETEKRWDWEKIQVKLFHVNTKVLTINQIQSTGASFINKVTNLVVTFYSAKLVITGEITLGMLLSISYILGQMNGPILQLISFIHAVQDANISLERLNEIHSIKSEEKNNSNFIDFTGNISEIALRSISFRYEGKNDYSIKNLSAIIPINKTTAIVGYSGSGKTTLMKLLLKFYEVSTGSIYIGSQDIDKISFERWRNMCGVVMQDGYIFSDSVLNNITMTSEGLDKNRLIYAIEAANIQEFVEKLTDGYDTKIGMEGSGLSAGQKQRILIARAIYKNPEFIFFDEATSNLDAENESIIMDNLKEFFQGRTVIVIAHRLSTVKNADNILVLDKGKMVESGTHSDLIDKRGIYHSLVKKQLSLV